ncbi:MAG: hypothetical protein M1826_003142 [Phylliscum demangeonii]|nr:MAG: hypothetical protein M1826_003142 [Phylliscum demangeonii]
MCRTMTWESTICDHIYIFKPLGDCANPAPDQTCHQPVSQTKLRSLCRECLAETAQGHRQRLITFLYRCWSYEYDRIMSQQGYHNPEPEVTTEQEYHTARVLAGSLAMELGESSVRFNAARRRFAAKINQFIDEYEAEGNTGPVFRPLAGQDGMPALAPVRMYGDVMRYLARVNVRLIRDLMVLPPAVDAW